MKAGFVQYTPVFCQPEKNLAKLDSLLKNAPKNDLLVLPELSNSGYNFKNKQQAIDSGEEINKSPFIDFLHQHCKANNSFIAAGMNEKENNKLFNTAVLVGPDGLVGRYRKIHLFMNEKDFFEPGNTGVPVFETPIGKIGLLVCFDWIFPEVWRIAALKGAEVICHCSNLVLPGFAQKSVPTHALINHYFVITANRTGTEEDLTFTGMSTISSPKGEVIYQAHAASEETKVFDFELARARDKQMTPRNHLLDDRRPELYRELVEDIK
ncbi:MAG: nitrilase-related carbon-nitrogen hydrolase [Candidatus Rifleibacteriota bacterium]